MIDLHCHLLPDVDDGSRSVEQSVGVLARFAEEGVTGVILTPHLKASEIARSTDGAPAWRAAAFEALRAAAPAVPRLHLGFEILLDEPLAAAAVSSRGFSLAGSRYHLVEFHGTVVASFAATILSQIVEAGGIPVVAHPERYQACSPKTVSAWRAVGARIQVDATTLTRPSARGQRARDLLEAGLADVLAADNHGDHRSLATAARYLSRRSAATPLAQLTLENPTAVVEDRPMSDVGGVPLGGRWKDRWRRLLEG